MGDEEEFQGFVCMTDDDLADFIALDNDEMDRAIFGESWTQQDVRDALEDLGDRLQDWQGIPVPIGDDVPIILQPRHPMAGFYRDISPPEDTGLEPGERVVNRWWDGQRNRMVYVIDKDGRRSSLVVPFATDRSMERLGLWLRTIGGADGWNLNAEHEARARLREMLTDRQWHHYDMTGAFIETSPRSRITYIFRRLRPTVALAPDNRALGEEASMKCLAVLCLHPIGYYSNTWAGCMVPSDDVIAHLSMMRGDEAMFWGKSIQHRPDEPEAGL